MLSSASISKARLVPARQRYASFAAALLVSLLEHFEEEGGDETLDEDLGVSRCYVEPLAPDASSSSAAAAASAAAAGDQSLISRARAHYRGTAHGGIIPAAHAFPTNAPNSRLTGWRVLKSLDDGMGLVKIRTKKKRDYVSILRKGRDTARELLARVADEGAGQSLQSFHGGRSRSARGVVLLVDSREGGGERHHLGAICQTLTTHRVRFETCPLPNKLHDYVFVWRDGNGSGSYSSSSSPSSLRSTDWLLPPLVERKSHKDVPESIRDGRWQRQKELMISTVATLWPPTRSAGTSTSTSTGIYLLEKTAHGWKSGCGCGCNGVAGCARPGGGKGKGRRPYPTVERLEALVAALHADPRFEVFDSTDGRATALFLKVCDLDYRYHPSQFDSLPLTSSTRPPSALLLKETALRLENAISTGGGLHAACSHRVRFADVKAILRGDAAPLPHLNAMDNYIALPSTTNVPAAVPGPEVHSLISDDDEEEVSRVAAAIPHAAAAAADRRARQQQQRDDEAFGSMGSSSNSSSSSRADRTPPPSQQRADSIRGSTRFTTSRVEEGSDANGVGTYCPRRHQSTYALLIALLLWEEEHGFKMDDGPTKQEWLDAADGGGRCVVGGGTGLCYMPVNESHTNANAAYGYDGWASVTKKLLGSEKDGEGNRCGNVYVLKRTASIRLGPARFRLTKLGRRLARVCHRDAHFWPPLCEEHSSATSCRRSLCVASSDICRPANLGEERICACGARSERIGRDMFDLMPFALLPKVQLTRRTQMRALVAKEHGETGFELQLSTKVRVVASSSLSSSPQSSSSSLGLGGASATVVIGIDGDDDDEAAAKKPRVKFKTRALKNSELVAQLEAFEAQHPLLGIEADNRLARGIDPKPPKKNAKAKVTKALRKRSAAAAAEREEEMGLSGSPGQGRRSETTTKKSTAAPHAKKRAKESTRTKRRRGQADEDSSALADGDDDDGLNAVHPAEAAVRRLAAEHAGKEYSGTKAKQHFLLASGTHWSSALERGELVKCGFERNEHGEYPVYAASDVLAASVAVRFNGDRLKLGAALLKKEARAAAKRGAKRSVSGKSERAPPAAKRRKQQSSSSTSRSNSLSPPIDVLGSALRAPGSCAGSCAGGGTVWSVLSYNVWFNSAACLRERMVGLVLLIRRKKPSCVLLQEVTHMSLPCLRSSLEAEGWSFSLQRDFRSSPYFTAIAVCGGGSRDANAHCQFRRPDSVSADGKSCTRDFAGSLMGRALQFAVLEKKRSGAKIIVATTHAESPMGRGKKSYTPERVKQLGYCRKFLRDLARKEKCAVLFGGDMNWHDPRDGCIAPEPALCDAKEEEGDWRDIWAYLANDLHMEGAAEEGSTKGHTYDKLRNEMMRGALCFLFFFSLRLLT